MESLNIKKCMQLQKNKYFTCRWDGIMKTKYNKYTIISAEVLKPKKTLFV